MKLFEDRSFDAAAEKAAVLVKVYPEAPAIWNIYGGSLQETGQLDAAVEAFQRAVELAPENGKLIYNLARLHQKRNEHKTAIRLLKSVTELQPDWAKAHIMLGLSLEIKGHIKDAIACYTRSVALSPKDAKIQNRLGAILEQDGRFDEAIGCFQKAIAVKPDYPEAHYNLGNALKKTNRPSDAIASYRTAIKLNPDFAKAWFNLGNTLFDQDHHDDCLRCYDKVIRLRPNDVNAMKKRGSALIALGDMDSADLYYRNLLSQFPGDPDLHFSLGQVHKAQGDMSRAIGAYSEAYRLDANHTGAFTALVSSPTGTLSRDAIQTLARNHAAISAGVSIEKRLFLRAHVLRHAGALEKSWENYVRANTIIYSRNRELVLQTARAQQRTLARLRTLPAPNTVHQGDDPVSVFILGPSRSGKTTLEALLGTSPQIRRGYENPPFISMIEQSAAAFGLRPVKRLLDLTPDARDDFLDRYGKHLRMLCKDRHIFTDTSPHRIFNAWDIADLIPNAFFIFVQRDPLDTAVDIFWKHYHSANHYAHHPMTICHHVTWYRQVQDILAEQLGERAVIIDREELTSNPTKALTRIEAMLGRTLGCAIPPSLPGYGTKEARVFRGCFEAMLKTP